MKKSIQIIIMIIGIALVCVGLFLPVPSKELTTYSFMADSGYSVIEEYVGGDAYNYIIGAALVGGEIAGAKTQKAIYTVSGLFLICAGLVLFDMGKREGISKYDQNNKEYYAVGEGTATSKGPVVENIVSDGQNSEEE